VATSNQNVAKRRWLQRWAEGRSQARRRLKSNVAARTLAFCAGNSIAAMRPEFNKRSRATAPRDLDLCAFVRVKNEGRFLPEWLVHHHLLGVQHFFIYDNNSDDDLAARLQPMIDAGLVTLRDWPQVPVFPSALIDYLARDAHRVRWIMALDADEFLCSKRGYGTLRRELKEFRHPALAVNWRYFGSSGHTDIPEGLVLRNFDHGAPERDHHVKVIFRPEELAKLRNAHNFYYRRGRLARTADGSRVFGSFVRPDPSPLEIRHFVYRSREDYAAKCARGFATARGTAERARIMDRIESEFVRHNEVHLPLPEPMLKEITARLLDLGYGRPYS
jgi:hypothetical protein